MGGLACLRQQFALAALVDAADERYIVFRHSVEANDREQSVLLRTTDDHSCNNVQNSYRLSRVIDCLVLWQVSFYRWNIKRQRRQGNHGRERSIRNLSRPHGPKYL